MRQIAETEQQIKVIIKIVCTYVFSNIINITTGHWLLHVNQFSGDFFYFKCNFHSVSISFDSVTTIHRTIFGLYDVVITIKCLWHQY